MARQDDPSISGNLLLYRRIPPWADRVIWDDQGSPAASSLNFKDKDDELSLHIASETTPDSVLAGHDGFGLVSVTAQQVRDVCGASIIICRDDKDPANGHVLVCGKISGGKATKLRSQAKWVAGRWPKRISP